MVEENCCHFNLDEETKNLWHFYILDIGKQWTNSTTEISLPGQGSFLQSSEGIMEDNDLADEDWKNVQGCVRNNAEGKDLWIRTGPKSFQLMRVPKGIIKCGLN